MKISKLVVILILLVSITGVCSSCKNATQTTVDSDKQNDIVSTSVPTVTEIPDIITKQPAQNEVVVTPAITAEPAKNEDGLLAISEDDIEYKNDKYGYTFLIPAAWEGKYKMIEDEKNTSFVYLQEQNQAFFSIWVYTEDEYNEMMKDPEDCGDLLTQDGNIYYVLSTPLDLIIMDQEQAEDFTNIDLSIVQIKERFWLNE